MIRTRKEKGYFVGTYLEKQQYDILHAVSEQKHITIADLLRMAIASHIEPMYQAAIPSNKVASNDNQS